jgi:hypothetical protein
MNVNYVTKHLINADIKTVDGINFHQKRRVEDGYIIKDITFTVNNERHEFQERVKALSLNDFKALFDEAGVHLLDIFW